MSVVSVLTLRRFVILTCLINTVCGSADSISSIGRLGGLEWDLSVSRAVEKLSQVLLDNPNLFLIHFKNTSYLLML